MKTGRLLKFPRPGVELHVYLYQDGREVRAAVYALGPGVHGPDPIHTWGGASEAMVEEEVRAWIDAHYPKAKLAPDRPK
jgi:hypothetical protein